MPPPPPPQSKTLPHTRSPHPLLRRWSCSYNHDCHNPTLTIATIVTIIIIIIIFKVLLITAICCVIRRRRRTQVLRPYIAGDPTGELRSAQAANQSYPTERGDRKRELRSAQAANQSYPTERGDRKRELRSAQAANRVRGSESRGDVGGEQVVAPPGYYELERTAEEGKRGGAVGVV